MMNYWVRLCWAEKATKVCPANLSFPDQALLKPMSYSLNAPKSTPQAFGHSSGQSG